MAFQVTMSLCEWGVVSNSLRAEEREPHLEYMVMRLLVKKGSG